MTISHPQIEVKDAARAGWFGAREESQLPAHIGESGLRAPDSESREARAGDTGVRVWLRRGRRVLFDLAIVLAALTTVPILTVRLANGAFWQRGFYAGPIRVSLRAAEASRPFTVPVDPSISPFEAGRSFAGLQQEGGNPAFPSQDTPSTEATWRFLNIGPGMFGTVRPVSLFGSGTSAVLEAAGKGLSADEIELLRKNAVSPTWREFDRVARAQSMDMIGGRFRLPFSPEATFSSMPAVRWGATTEMAYAAVARAAYHLAIGQRDSADAVLRSIVSFGFALIDNSTQLRDQTTGRTIVEIGRDGLERFYRLTGDPRAAAVRAARPDVPPRTAGPFAAQMTADQMREGLLKRAANPNELRGVRYESLELLTMSSCTNVRELLFGPRADVRDAFVRAKSELARNPSERALIDLMQREPGSNFSLQIEEASPVRRFLVGSATIAGAVLRNSRLAACTLLTTDGTINFR